MIPVLSLVMELPEPAEFVRSAIAPVFSDILLMAVPVLSAVVLGTMAVKKLLGK